MCTKIEIEEIIKYHLAEHEVGDIKRHIEFEDKLDRTLVAVRDSVPPFLSPFLKNVDERIEKLLQSIENHNNRITKNETVITYATGVVIGIGALASIVWLVVGDFLKSKIK
jgi:hypothetical protein